MRNEPDGHDCKKNENHHLLLKRLGTPVFAVEYLAVIFCAEGSSSDSEWSFSSRHIDRLPNEVHNRLHGQLSPLAYSWPILYKPDDELRTL